MHKVHVFVLSSETRPSVLVSVGDAWNELTEIAWRIKPISVNRATHVSSNVGILSPPIYGLPK